MDSGSEAGMTGIFDAFIWGGRGCGADWQRFYILNLAAHPYPRETSHRPYLGEGEIMCVRLWISNSF